MKNVQARKSKGSYQDIQETSATIVSQPAANKTSLLKRPHPGDNLFFDLVVISSVLTTLYV